MKPMPTHSMPSSRDAAVVSVGAAWGMSCVLLALSLPFAVLGLFVSAFGWITVLAYVLLVGSMASLLWMSVVTIACPEAYGWNADFERLPRLLRVPVNIGTAVGTLLLRVFDCAAILSLSTSIFSESARVSMSLIAGLGALATLLTAPLGVWTMALLCAWGLVVVILFGRGCYGAIEAIARLSSSARKAKSEQLP